MTSKRSKKNTFRDRALERIEAQKIEIRRLKNILRNQAQKIDKFSDLLWELKKEKLIDTKTALELSNVTALNKGILSKLEPKSYKKRRFVVYDEEILEFAQTVQFYSNEAYDYLRTLFELPHQTTLNGRIKSFQCLPGFISEALAEIESQKDDPNYQYGSLTMMA